MKESYTSLNNRERVSDIFCIIGLKELKNKIVCKFVRLLNIFRAFTSEIQCLTRKKLCSIEVSYPDSSVLHVEGFLFV